MNTLMKTALAACLLAGAAGSASAADSVDLKVTGEITPPSCTPSLTGGGIVDYGNIPAKSLSATNYTVLPEMQIDLTVTCKAPTKVALKPINGRPGSVAGSTEGAGGIAAAPFGVNLIGVTGGTFVAGLGKASNNAAIGGYAMRFVPGTQKADGAATSPLAAHNNSTSWIAAPPTGMFVSAGSFRFSWGTGSAPIAAQTFSTTLGVQAYINRASNLDTSSTITLDGLTTLELVYL